RCAGGGSRRRPRLRAMLSEAPPQPAPGAGLGRLVGQQRAAKRLVALSVPDLLQGLLGCIAEREAVIAAQRERGDAAGQRAAMRGEVHQRPGTPAQRPGPVGIPPLEARPRLGGARSVEEEAELAGERLGLADRPRLLLIEALEQGLLAARQS